MKTATDAGLLFRRYLTQLLRNPAFVVIGFATPILYLALFTPLLRHLAGAQGLPSGNVLDLFLPGILALLAYASGAGPASARSSSCAPGSSSGSGSPRSAGSPSWPGRSWPQCC